MKNKEPFPFKKSNFKALKTVETLPGGRTRTVLDKWNKSFFFGSYKGHGKRLRAIWNGLPLSGNAALQVDYTIIRRCLGFGNRRKNVENKNRYKI